MVEIRRHIITQIGSFLHHLKVRLLGNAVIGEAALVLELLPVEDESLLVNGNAKQLLNLCFDALNDSVVLNIEGVGGVSSYDSHVYLYSNLIEYISHLLLRFQYLSYIVGEANIASQLNVFFLFQQYFVSRIFNSLLLLHYSASFISSCIPFTVFFSCLMLI